MTIRSLLEHVGIDTTGKDIYVSDQVVDKWVPMNNKPENVTCPVCHKTYEYFLDADGDWDLDAAWWMTPEIPFLDSRHCYLQAAGYEFDREKGRWVK